MVIPSKWLPYIAVVASKAGVDLIDSLISIVGIVLLSEDGLTGVCIISGIVLNRNLSHPL